MPEWGEHKEERGFRKREALGEKPGIQKTMGYADRFGKPGILLLIGENNAIVLIILAVVFF